MTRPEVNGSLRTNMPTQTTPRISPSPIDTSTLSEASAADWRAVIPAVSTYHTASHWLLGIHCSKVTKRWKFEIT